MKKRLSRALLTIILTQIVLTLGSVLYAAWTTPRTWVSGEIVTAAQLNTHLRDNLNALIPVTSTITTTGTQTALALPVGRNDVTIFANNASLLTLQGIAAGSDGQQLTVYSIGAGQVDLANQSGSASAANRIANGVTGTVSLAAGSGHVLLQYDATAARWRVMAHEQGAWITPTFSAGVFTGNGSMTWTVDSGDVTTFAYMLKGRTMTLRYALATTTVGGTPSTALQITIPASFSAAGGGFSTGYAQDNGGGGVSGLVYVPGGATIQLFKDMTSANNWSAATNTSAVSSVVTFEVQ